VDWLPWSAAAVARARAERKPVLLCVEAPWCSASFEMARTTYADPAVCALAAARFIAIKVDADRRPDLAERYSLGGLPTTAFLDANGAIAGGGTFVPPERMVHVLTRAADAIATAPASPPPDDASSEAAGADGAVSDEALICAAFDSFDADHGGFGGAPKFPLTAPIELALALYRDSRDARMALIAETTLDAMGWRGLFDDGDGGFFRCAETRDWNLPRREKLLEVNASLLRLYVDAADALRTTRYLERASDVLRYVQTWLADQVDGGWANSQRGADGSIDTTLFATGNASMASSALRASLVLNDTGLGEFALRSLERVLLAAYRPGDGVAHYVDDRQPAVRGLLDDQVAMAWAQLDAAEATGNIVYEMMAQGLMHYALRTMWDEGRGGFFDRAEPGEDERIGLLRSRLKPFVANCDAARVLRRLARVTGEQEFADRAGVTLQAMESDAVRQGPLAAHYLLAQRERSARDVRT
jgi:uncharacterized protein YyaL (SSP411 family)